MRCKFNHSHPPEPPEGSYPQPDSPMGRASVPLPRVSLGDKPWEG